jgi:hypothetical protein
MLFIFVVELNFTDSSRCEFSSLSKIIRSITSSSVSVQLLLDNIREIARLILLARPVP